MPKQTPVERRAIDRQDWEQEVRAVLTTLVEEVFALKQGMTELRQGLRHQPIEKLRYSTTELAEVMNVSQHTVQECWCNQGRIEAAKNPDTGKWRVPASEYRRLVAGGSLRPPKKV